MISTFLISCIKRGRIYWKSLGLVKVGLRGLNKGQNILIIFIFQLVSSDTISTKKDVPRGIQARRAYSSFASK